MIFKMGSFAARKPESKTETRENLLAEQLRTAETNIERMKHDLTYAYELIEDLRRQVNRQTTLLKDAMKTLCSGEFYLKQLGGGPSSAEMTFEQMLALIIEDVRGQIHAYEEEAEKSRQLLRESDEQITMLQLEISRREEAAHQAEISRKEQDSSDSLNTSDADSTISSEVPERVIEMWRDRVSDKEKLFLKVVGDTGISRTKELSAHPEIIAGFSNKADVNRILEGLKNQGLVTVNPLVTGGRGKNYYIFTLAKMGKRIYRSLFGREPAEPMNSTLKNRHSSLEHGWLIQDAGEYLQALGFEVSYDEQDNTHTLQDGRRITVDLTAKKDTEVRYIEVERGTTTQEEFNEKCDKLMQICGGNYRFITPNREVQEHVKTQFFDWVLARGGMAALRGQTLYVATMENLKEDVWECMPLGVPARQRRS